MRAIRSPRCRVGIQPTPLREAPSYSDSDASQPHPPAIPACAAASRSQGWIPAFTAKEVARLFSVLSACTRSRSRLITPAPHPASPRKEAGRGDCRPRHFGPKDSEKPPRRSPRKQYGLGPLSPPLCGERCGEGPGDWPRLFNFRLAFPAVPPQCPSAEENVRADVTRLRGFDTYWPPRSLSRRGGKRSLVWAGAMWLARARYSEGDNSCPIQPCGDCSSSRRSRCC
jgi:hypothetical protein